MIDFILTEKENNLKVVIEKINLYKSIRQVSFIVKRVDELEDLKESLEWDLIEYLKNNYSNGLTIK